MKTFVAILKCQHCGKETPAVLNRIVKLCINRMDLKNDCDKCGMSLNEPTEQGGGMGYC